MSGLLFIRHAETDMGGTFCGQSNPPVNASGRGQIRMLIEKLRREPVAAILTSDLQRSMTTADALAEFFGIPYTTRRELREINFGSWEGLTWDEIERLDSRFAARWLEDFPHRVPPDGEAFDQFEARVRAETEYLLGQSRGGLIAVVTHAGFMRAVLRIFCGVDEPRAWKMTKDYCCTFLYAHDAEPQVRLQEVIG